MDTAGTRSGACRRVSTSLRIMRRFLTFWTVSRSSSPTGGVSSRCVTPCGCRMRPAASHDLLRCRSRLPVHTSETACLPRYSRITRQFGVRRVDLSHVSIRTRWWGPGFSQPSLLWPREGPFTGAVSRPPRCSSVGVPYPTRSRARRLRLNACCRWWSDAGICCQGNDGVSGRGSMRRWARSSFTGSCGRSTADTMSRCCTGGLWKPT